MPASLTLLDIFLCALAAFGASIIGGLAGYGTGLLMPIFLVPVIGPEPVIPLIGITAMFTNGGRIAAFHKNIDWRRALRIMAAAAPFTVLGAYAYSWLSGRGVLILIGLALLAAVPARRWLKSRDWQLSDGGLIPGGALYGLLAGGTNTSGVLLISMLMAAGMTPTAVIATDAAISFVMGLVKSLTFTGTGALTLPVALFAVIVGCATFPGGYVAKWLVERLSVKLHTQLLDGAVIAGAAAMLWRAWQM